MKIIGHTHMGYLVEMEPHEVAAITGNPKDRRHASLSSYSGDSRMLPIGAKLEVADAWQHLQKINQTAAARASIAERLRAAATLVEHTPVVLELPDPSPESVSVS